MPKVIISNRLRGLLPPEPYELKWGGRPMWYQRIGAFLNCDQERARKLLNDDLPAKGSEITIIELVETGQISLDTIIQHNLNRIEAKYESLR